MGPQKVKSIVERWPSIQRPQIKNAIDYKIGLRKLEDMRNEVVILNNFFKGSLVQRVKEMGFNENVIERVVQR